MYEHISSAPDTTMGNSPLCARPVPGNGGARVEDAIGINLMLISSDGLMQTLFMPYPPRGRLSFPVEAPVYAEAKDDAWHVCARPRARLMASDGMTVSSVALPDPGMMFASFGESEYILYAEELNEEGCIFHNYIAVPNTEIRIGRREDNDIVYPGNMISRHHASLSFDGKRWRVWDNDSANGVFVNGQRIQEKTLRPGEVISVMGLRMIAGSGFISINDGYDRIRISPAHLRRVDGTDGVMNVPGQDAFRKEEKLFNRLPRQRMAMKDADINIETPPMPMNGEKLPFMMRMGSSMVMGGSAALSGNVAMLASSILLPALTGRYSKEEREEYEAKRHERYGEYLEAKRQEILEEKQRQEKVLRYNYQPLSDVLGYTTDKKRLWERRKTDDDFLTLRVGSGEIPLKGKVNCAPRRLEMDPDDLLEEMYDLAEREVRLEQVPIMQNLFTDPVWGVLGEHDAALSLVRAMIMRLAILYSYDEVKLVFLVDPEDKARMEYISWLPHAWDDQRRIRFVACETADVCHIGEHIKASLGEDLERPGKLADMMKKHPHYIVFALSKRLFDCMEVLKTALQQEDNCGVSVITMFDEVPKECSLLLESRGRRGEGLPYEYTAIHLKELDRENDEFTLDAWDEEVAERSMREIANTNLRLASGNYTLPKTLTFLEMFGVGRVEHLNIARRWQENTPVSSLAVPIGVGTDGETFMLDLHQKFQGPHGLVAGTTGSGKSEFLLTYILSLAVNFHPDEVAFVLIDYKGGGLAGAFDDPANGIRLPHLAGTITNLDGAAIARSLISLQSEMQRRQRVFNEAKSMVGEGTMDIYTYQRLYRMGSVPEPMPHLFIISDEFAELKQQQPEFLDQLVSIARIGRSLGVHLILATQKPAGVVSDQIVSNTKFRVCLKVADRADSMDMLKRPDAAEIRETGRFYLQVGNNELFVMGQSAWSGAEYQPQDEVVVKRDESIQVVDATGGTVLEVKPEAKKTTTGKSQLVTIVRTLADMAAEMGVSTRQLWVPALAKKLDMTSERLALTPDPDAGRIRYCAGLLDDPAHQVQHRMILEMDRINNLLVCGTMGGGKTTFVQTLLLSLAEKYGPDEVQFYILDYSSRLLNLFAKLPHCGAALGEEHESQLNNFFKLIDQIVQERKKLFTELEADSYETACKSMKIPLILVVIDNLSGFKLSKPGEAHYDRMHEYLKNASNYGVRYIMTISSINEATSRIKQEMIGRVAINLKDKYDYSDMIGKRIDYVPPKGQGRGLFMLDETPLEMQLASFEAELDDKARIAALKDRIAELAERWKGIEGARRLPVISETETYEHFARSFAPLRFPLGYSLRSGEPVALPLKQFGMLSLYFGNPESTSPVLDNFLMAAQRENMAILFLKRREGSVFDKLEHTETVKAVAGDPDGISILYRTVLHHANNRYAGLKEYCEEKGLDPKSPDIHRSTFDYMHENNKPIIVFIERYADICKASREMEGLITTFSSIYLLGRRTQIYVIGGFYPEDQDLLMGSKLFDCFNPDQLTMLFGGSYAKQKLVNLPYEMSKNENPSAYNRCIMNYRKQLHPLLMPCGEKKQEEEEEDERPIFGPQG